jgi:hypothetical protein
MPAEQQAVYHAKGMTDGGEGRLSRNAWRSILFGCILGVGNCSQGIYNMFHDERLEQEALAQHRPPPPKLPRNLRLLDAVLRSLLVAAGAWVVSELVIPRRKESPPPSP